MANPYDYGELGFRWLARWEAAWPTILGRLNLLLGKLDWCKWEIDNAGGAALPTGYWDDPLPVGGGYLWHDPDGHCFRLKESAPSSAADGVAVGTGGEV